MILQEKIQKKAKGFGKLAPAFLEGAKFALENQWISVEDEPFDSQLISVIEDAFYGTQRLHDGKILYDKGVISSCEKMADIKKYMPEFYVKFIEMYGNENNK